MHSGIPNLGGASGSVRVVPSNYRHGHHVRKYPVRHRGPSVGWLPGLTLGLVTVQVGVGFFIKPAALLLGAILVVLIVWQARAEYFPVLMLNQLTAGNFAFFGVDAMAAAPNLVSYVLALAIVVRVVVELCVRPATFRSDRWILFLWIPTVLLAILMSVMGREAGGMAWTLPVRTVALCGAYFYGQIVAQRSDAAGPSFGKAVHPVICVLLLLFFGGWLSHKLMFILVGLVFPLVVFTWKKQNFALKCVSCLSVLFCAYLGGAGGAFGALEEPEESFDVGTSSGLGGSTLTLNGLLVGSIGLTLLVKMSSVRARQMMARILGWPAAVAVVVASLLVAIVGPSFTIETSASKEELSFSERIQAKLFDDRSIIWNSALEDVLRPPWVLKASGEILIIKHPKWGNVEWEHGAHNAVLNTLMRQRWLNGGILLLLFGVAMHKSARGLARDPSGVVVALSVFVAVTGTMGMIANDYPMDPLASFWFFSFAGLAGSPGRSAEALRIYVRAAKPSSAAHPAGGAAPKPSRE